jgi:hypothetical protein
MNTTRSLTGARSLVASACAAALLAGCSGQGALAPPPGRSPDGFATSAHSLGGMRSTVTFALGTPRAIAFRSMLDFPDEHVSFLKYDSGSQSYWTIWSANRQGRGVVYQADAALDPGSFTMPAGNPIFGPADVRDKDPANFDKGYAGAGQVVRDPNDPSVLYMLYEGNNDCYGQTCAGSNYAWANPGIAVATGGPFPTGWAGPSPNPWGRTAAVLTPDQPNRPTSVPAQPGYFGDGLPSGIVDPNDPTYLYLYYSYHPYPRPQKPFAQIEVARDAFSDLESGMPGGFKKYDAADGAFDAAYNGAGSAIVAAPADGKCNGDVSQPAVSWNTALGEYVMVFTCHNMGGATALWYYSTCACATLSSQNWSTPVLLKDWGNQFSPRPSPVSPDQQDSSTTSGTGLIFYQHGNYKPYIVPFTIGPS